MTYTADLTYGPFHPQIKGDTLESVQREFNRQREESGLGYHDWGPALVKRDGKPFCEISYNGRAWPLVDGKIAAWSYDSKVIAESPI